MGVIPEWRTEREPVSVSWPGHWLHGNLLSYTLKLYTVLVYVKSQYKVYLKNASQPSMNPVVLERLSFNEYILGKNCYKFPFHILLLVSS